MDPRTTTNDVVIVVRLPHDLREELKKRAAAEDRSMASLLRVAVRIYLDAQGTRS